MSEGAGRRRLWFAAIVAGVAVLTAGVTALLVNVMERKGEARTTYVRLELWPEALEQLRVATLLLPLEEQEGIDELVEKVDTAYQARFFPPDAPPQAVSDTSSR